MKNVALFIGLIAILSITGAAQKMDMSNSKTPTDAQKIAQAESAGPAAITKGATIVDMATMKQLRAGTNGWMCLADSKEPMCLDKTWQGWATAWMKKEQPNLTASGVAYMLSGDTGASNTDPFAKAGTKDNKWVVSGPHIMLLYPDAKMLDAYPDDPNNGGPWVMWRGTPYAHVMVPVTIKNQVTMPVIK